MTFEGAEATREMMEQRFIDNRWGAFHDRHAMYLYIFDQTASFQLKVPNFPFKVLFIFVGSDVMSIR